MYVPISEKKQKNIIWKKTYWKDMEQLFKNAFQI